MTMTFMLSFEAQRLRLLEEFVRRTGRLSTRFARSSRRPEHLEVGRRGEEAAYFYLRRQGFTVVARGWRTAKLPGDLDVVAWEDDILCFVEVKTRTSRNVATAESAVDEEKCRKLRRMARQYLRGLGRTPEQVRFDILSIYFENGKDAEFEFFRNAFGWY